ncbi:MAG: hypothetical protein LUO80_08575 [Methylococcaceae bacterium]|nr:hypothetical protein [Methylococcaceae bacterium]
MVSRQTAGSTLLVVMAKNVLRAFLLCGLLVGCTSVPQIYSTSQYETISLKTGDLERDGLAILTPDTVWTRDEDRQALALAVVEVFRNERPDIRCLGLPETLNRLNRADRSTEYRQMLVEYRESGLFPKPLLQRIGQAVGTRYVAHLKLAGFDQSYDTRLSAFGLRLLGTKYANARLFLQIWDTETATIAWEGSEESNYAIDTGMEQSIAFKTIVEEMTRNMIANLPGNPPKKS